MKFYDMDILRDFIKYASDSSLRERERTMFPAESPFNAKGNTGDKIHLRIQPQINEQTFQGKIRKVQSTIKLYKPLIFPEKRPEFEEIEKVVMAEARKKIRSFKFWTLPRLRDDYVGENTFPRYKEAVRKWEKEKMDFDESEIKRVAELNKSEHERVEIEIKSIEDDMKVFLSSSLEGVSWRIQSALESMWFPYGLSIAYAWSENTVFLDVLYPERDVMLKSEYRSAPRTLTESNFRYINVLLGSPYVFASHIFNLGTAVRNVVVIGHSQLLDSKVDMTYYAVNFDRVTFQTEFMSVKKFNPINSISKYQYLFDATPVRGIIHPIRLKFEYDLFHNGFDQLQFRFMSVSPAGQKLPDFQVRETTRT